MRRSAIEPANIENVEPNVFLNDGVGKGYYDRTAKRLEMLTLLPDTFITNDQYKEGWIPDIINKLEKEGYLERVIGGSKVLKPIWGSPSGTAALVLGKNGPKKPNGYTLWTFADGTTIK
ncbi:hypothetical protein [Neobacillus vireti]|uniref:hypothetical protein n=1 Tax=Neobacillus vireti TaxID=220686 RepID=UPI002FFEF89E